MPNFACGFCGIGPCPARMSLWHMGSRMWRATPTLARQRHFMPRSDRPQGTRVATLGVVGATGETRLQVTVSFVFMHTQCPFILRNSCESHDVRRPRHDKYNRTVRGRGMSCPCPAMLAFTGHIRFPNTRATGALGKGRLHRNNMRNRASHLGFGQTSVPSAWRDGTEPALLLPGPSWSEHYQCPCLCAQHILEHLPKFGHWRHYKDIFRKS